METLQPPESREVEARASRLTRVRPAIERTRPKPADLALDRIIDYFHLAVPAALREFFGRYLRQLLSPNAKKCVQDIARTAKIAPSYYNRLLGDPRWNDDELRNLFRSRSRILRASSPHDFTLVLDTVWHRQEPRKAAMGLRLGSLPHLVNVGMVQPGHEWILESEAYFPAEWLHDAGWCKSRGVATGTPYRKPWQIAHDLLRELRKRGLGPQWILLESRYGRERDFLRALESGRFRYIAEVPGDFTGWLSPPDPEPALSNPVGTSRIGSPYPTDGQRPAYSVKDLSRGILPSEKISGREDYSRGGPQAWLAGTQAVYLGHEYGHPKRSWLTTLKRADTGESRFFLSNHSPNTALEKLARFALFLKRAESRLRETAFSCGIDHVPILDYRKMKRHLLFASISTLIRSELMGAEGLPI